MEIEIQKMKKRIYKIEKDEQTGIKKKDLEILDER